MVLGMSVSFQRLRLRRAAFAPSLPRAVRVLAGSFEMVRFARAAFAAFLMFRRAAVFCLLDAMVASFKNREAASDSEGSAACVHLTRPWRRRRTPAHRAAATRIRRSIRRHA